MESDEKICICALNKIFGYKPWVALKLMSCMGSASAIFDTDKQILHSVTGPFTSYFAKINDRALEDSRKELEVLERQGCRFICIGDPEYPALLKECDDPPLGLYIKTSGSIEKLFNSKPPIAIVGTRDISLYGKEWCEKTVGYLSHAGTKPLIVSGLALGTDITAQETALECGLPTVSVMATGIDRIYPYANRGAAERIAATEGCALVTDYPPGTAPIAINFIRRNRIIAGMCGSTILMESRIRGGGMTTAKLAFAYQRDVYALPGRIDDSRSQGCNLLIDKKIAEPITDIGELSIKLGLGKTSGPETGNITEKVRKRYGNESYGCRLDSILCITDAIKNNRGIDLDELCEITGKPYSEIAGITGLLESDGIIVKDIMQRCTINIKNM